MQLTKQQYYDDINYLLSCMRVRQNNFIFLIQKHKNFEFQFYSKQTLSQISYQFLEEQQQHSQNINSYLIKYMYLNTNNQNLSEYTNRFWIKLKRLMKISLQRIKLLALCCETLQRLYEQIMNNVHIFINQTSELKQLRQIEYILERKYNYIIFGNYKQHVVSEQFGKQYKGSIGFQQNKSNLCSTDKLSKSKKRKNSPSINIPHKLIKSVQKKFPKDELSSNMNMIEKDNKRLIRLNEKLSNKIYNVMNVKLDLGVFDVKKSRQNNASNLYDQLFQRNIPNHKIITKYVFEINKKIEKLNINKKLNLKNKRVLINNKKDQFNKSLRKTKKILKRVSKNIDEQVQNMKSYVFGQNGLRKLQDRMIKLRPRPKTAKLQKHDHEIKLIFQNSKKRYTKLLKKVK